MKKRMMLGLLCSMVYGVTTKTAAPEIVFSITPYGIVPKPGAADMSDMATMVDLLPKTTFAVLGKAAAAGVQATLEQQQQNSIKFLNDKELSVQVERICDTVENTIPAVNHLAKEVARSADEGLASIVDSIPVNQVAFLMQQMTQFAEARGRLSMEDREVVDAALFAGGEVAVDRFACSAIDRQVLAQALQVRAMLQEAFMRRMFLFQITRQR